MRSFLGGVKFGRDFTDRIPAERAETLIRVHENALLAQQCGRRRSSPTSSPTGNAEVLGQSKKRIALLGTSFKSGTDNVRESPFLEMVERLIGNSRAIRVFDPNVQLAGRGLSGFNPACREAQSSKAPSQVPGAVPLAHERRQQRAPAIRERAITAYAAMA